MKKMNLKRNITGVNVNFNVTVFDEAEDAISKFSLDSLAFASNEDSFISVEVDKYCFSLVTNGVVEVNKLDGNKVIETYSNSDFDVLKNLVQSKEIYTNQYEIVSSNSFQVEYGVIKDKDGDVVTFDRIDEPVDFVLESCNITDLISMFVLKCEHILEDLLYRNEIIGEILDDGDIEKGRTDQGLVYKNPLAFRQKNGICYVAELSEYEYTYEDFLNISNGNEDIANIIFETVDWQSPGTLYDEYIQNDEIYECAKCKKSYLSYEVDNCPFCGDKKIVD